MCDSTTFQLKIIFSELIIMNRAHGLTQLPLKHNGNSSSSSNKLAPPLSPCPFLLWQIEGILFAKHLTTTGRVLQQSFKASYSKIRLPVF